MDTGTLAGVVCRIPEAFAAALVSRRNRTNKRRSACADGKSACRTTLVSRPVANCSQRAQSSRAISMHHFGQADSDSPTPVAQGDCVTVGGRNENERSSEQSWQHHAMMPHCSLPVRRIFTASRSTPSILVNLRERSVRACSSLASDPRTFFASALGNVRLVRAACRRRASIATLTPA